MNSFGRNFRITIFGSSHGPYTGILMDGIPPGIALDSNDFCHDISRRSSGRTGSTLRRESDIPEIISGTYNGRTSGTPLVILFKNGDTKSEDYGKIASHPRPSHADLTAHIKYGGYNDPRGGGQFSGRMTLPLVAAGVVAKKILKGVSFDTILTEVGGESDPNKWEHLLSDAKDSGDSLGGIVKVTVSGVHVGYGDPFFDSLESSIGHLVFSIPGIKGVEFGSGFGAARSCGKDNNDIILDSSGRTASNNDGGVNGGISNGNPLIISAAFKPAPSIAAAQDTYSFKAGKRIPLEIGGRHDACIALRGAVAVEAAVAIVLAEMKLRRS